MTAQTSNETYFVNMRVNAARRVWEAKAATLFSASELRGMNPYCPKGFTKIVTVVWLRNAGPTTLAQLEARAGLLPQFADCLV